MLDHNEIQELLAGYALGDLGPDQAEVVGEHITYCSDCKQELESIRLVLECAGQMSKVSVDDDMCVSAKEGLLLSLSPGKTETAVANTAKIIQWRTIMQSKVTRYAAAAVVILGVFIGMYVLGISPDGSSVAWASLAERVEQVKTVIYRMHSTTVGESKVMSGESDMEMMMSSEYGMRMDTFMDGKLTTQAYVIFADKTIVTLMPEAKKYAKLTLTDDLQEKMRKQSYDPKEMIGGFMKSDYVELGQKEIDGVLVEGIEINDSVMMGMPVEGLKGQLWVDVKTDFPVLLEMEMETKIRDKLMTIKMVMNGFQWNVELDKSEFEYVIPEDYESLGDVIMPEMNAKSAVESLTMIAKAIDGRYPKSLSLMDCASEVSGIINEKKKQTRKLKRKAAKAATDAGLDPEADPEVVKAEAILKSLELGFNEQMKIQGLALFYMQLNQQKKDPAYYGDRVTSADADMILMRWLNDKGGYTVIFGDLSTGDFSPEEVGEMEAKLPELPVSEESVEVVEVVEMLADDVPAE